MTIANKTKIRYPQKKPLLQYMFSIYFVFNLESFFIIILVSLNAYKWLVVRLLVDSDARLKQNLKTGKDSFSARNDSQVYYCRSLAIAFIEV